MSFASVLVQRVPLPTEHFVEKRATARHVCGGEAVSRPLDAQDALCWGAQVRDLSTGGIGLSLCFPFKLGTLLAIDLQETSGIVRTVLGRVVRVNDQTDGTWLVGCEFVKALSDSDMDLII